MYIKNTQNQTPFRLALENGSIYSIVCLLDFNFKVCKKATSFLFLQAIRTTLGQILIGGKMMTVILCCIKQ